MKTYQAQLRVPTGDDFAYIEVTVEDTAENIVQAHREFTNLVRPIEGLPTKEWNKLIDNYVQERGMSTEDMLKLGKAQAWWIKEFDKMRERLANKNRDIIPE